MKEQQKKPFTISDAHFRAFVEKSWDVLVFVDRSSRVLYATPSIVRMFGRDYNEFVGVRGLRFIYALDLPKALKTFAQVVTSSPGSVTSLEIRILHKDGYYKWVEAKATNLLSDPEVRAVVINFHDITASKELEERKNEFISIASHELRTPITSLKLYTQLLTQELQKSPASAIKTVRKMDDQIDHLQRLINDLLDVSKIQENKMTLQKETFSLEELVREVVSDLQIRIATHKIQVKSSFHGTVTADKFRISQALINLIMNAVKYSPQADKVVVTITSLKKDIRVRVKDFGIGIAKKDQHRIFERFFQSESRNKTGGLGLGLYITATIVREHHGQLLVESKKGEGTTFTMQLPKD